MAQLRPSSGDDVQEHTYTSFATMRSHNWATQVGSNRRSYGRASVYRAGRVFVCEHVCLYAPLPLAAIWLREATKYRFVFVLQLQYRLPKMIAATILSQLAALCIGNCLKDFAKIFSTPLLLSWWNFDTGNNAWCDKATMHLLPRLRRQRRWGD